VSATEDERDGRVTGPLRGVRVLEIGGIGPVPFAGMLLADMGADVLRIDRANQTATFPRELDVTLRGRACVTVDLRRPEGRDLVLDLCARADALIEGHRPGVMERLGLGPAEVAERNPRLVYGRMTGYGQTGPLAGVAGHDINYIALAGVLGSIARAGERPLAPLNLVGDYAGGAMFLAFGVVCGVLEARGSGQGQVVDAAMVEGAAALMAMFTGFRAAGGWRDEAGTNLLDSGAHFYEVYATADHGHVAVGALEPQFYARLLELLEVDPATAPQWDRERWPTLKERFAALFAARTRDEWRALFEHEDACVSVVLGLGEAPEHPHLAARGVYETIDGVVQPAAAPRFARTPGRARPADPEVAAALERWGVSLADQERAREAGALGPAAS
jgi:alpha-methylacyl-CoA racemase